MSVRVGFVGCGGIAQVHLKNVQASGNAEIVAVCDVVEKAAEAAARDYKAVPYTNFKTMLDEEQLDAVFVSVPPFAHEDIEESIVGRGIHLFVEKPLGLDMETVERKREIIESSGVLTATGYCLRYLDIVQEAKDYLQNRSVAMVNGYYLTSLVPTSWWKVKSKSGGQLVEQSTHLIDLMRYLAGEVTEVQAMMALNTLSTVEGLDIEDVGSINLRFSSGAIGHLATTFVQPDHRLGVEVLGQDFRVHVDATTLTIVENNQTLTKKSTVDFYKEQDLAFLKAVETGDASLILAPYGEALRTLAVTLAANRSSETEQTMKL